MWALPNSEVISTFELQKDKKEALDVVTLPNSEVISTKFSSKIKEKTWRVS